MKKEFRDIIELCSQYYRNRDEFYHNLKHIVFTIEKGLEILKSMKVLTRLQRVYVYAMAFHDARHSCGKEINDQINIKEALRAFRESKKDKIKLTLLETRMIECIIRSTAVPHAIIETFCARHHFGKDSRADLEMLVDVARDVDTIGIIGIEDQEKREQAMVGLLRENLRNTSRETLEENYHTAVFIFFNQLQFKTSFLQKWATSQLLEERKQWQLTFFSKIIDQVHKDHLKAQEKIA